MASPLKPVGIGLVVCDNVYRESGNKQALVGLFNRIRSRQFPAVHPKMCVYASVTDVRPNTVLALDIVHSETDQTVTRLEGPPPGAVEPTTICDLVFELQNLEFPEPGRYYIRFHGNNHILLQRPFEVEVIGSGESNEAEAKE